MKQTEAQEKSDIRERSYLIEAIDRKTALAEARKRMSKVICEGKTGCGNTDQCNILKKISKSEENSKDKENKECISRNVLIIDSGNITKPGSPKAQKSGKTEEKEKDSGSPARPESKTAVLRDILFKFTSQTFASSEYKAVIITDADKLSVQSQNTLLKILEEPPPRIIFILTTAKKRKLLPTILSRCIILKAKAETEEPVKDLAEQFDLTRERAQIILDSANGDFYYAQKLAESDYFKLRDDMIEALDRIWKLKNFATSPAEHLICGDYYVGGNSKAKSKDLESEKEDQKKAAANQKNQKIDPETVEKNLEIALIYIQDILNFKYGTVKAANSDRIDDITRHSNLSDFMIVQTAENFARLLQKMALCKGMNVRLGVTSTLFDILEAVI